MTTRVVNIKDSGDPGFPTTAVRIDRTTKWGNPFSHLTRSTAANKVATRDEAIARHREWIWTQPELLASLHEIRDQALACFCAPQHCHGHTLAHIADRYQVQPPNEMFPETAEEYVISGGGPRNLATLPDEARALLLEELAHWLLIIRAYHPTAVVLSGGAEGFDAALAVAASSIGMVYDLELPNTSYGPYWWGSRSKTSRNRLGAFRALERGARNITYTCGSKITEGGVPAPILRNAAMARKGHCFLYWHASRGGTKNMIEKIKTEQRLRGKPNYEVTLP